MGEKAKIWLGSLLFSAAAWAGEPVAGRVFTAFDVETTGFRAASDRIVEIGAVKFRGDGRVLASTNWLVNPQQPIPEIPSEVHGITSEMVKDAPLFGAVGPAFFDFCAESLLLAHNARFDIGFIRAEAARSGCAVLELEVLDTLPLFRAWFPGASDHSLEGLAAHLRIQGGAHHRAEADSFYIMQIFKQGLRQRPSMTVRELIGEAGGRVE